MGYGTGSATKRYLGDEIMTDVKNLAPASLVFDRRELRLEWWAHLSVILTLVNLGN